MKIPALLKRSLLALAILPVAGCGISDVIAIGCLFSGSESDHCYQAVAVQSSDPDECKRIQGKKFKQSNPPRDKCYMMIAENTGNYDICDEMEGGLLSYEPEECIQRIAVKKVEPEGCLRAYPKESYEKCMKAVGPKIPAVKLMEVIQQTREAEKSLEALTINGQVIDPQAKKKYDNLYAKQQQYFKYASEAAAKEAMDRCRDDLCL